MTYTLTIAGKEIPIEVELRDDGTLTAILDGKTREARYRFISDNQVHIELDGKGKNVFLCADRDGKLIHVDGITYLVRDAEATARRPKAQHGELPQEVTPPMPSVVVRVMVAEGDMVAKGQGVVTVSAMKMETTLQAPFAGRVAKINVTEGEKVMPGRILVDIERQEEEHG